MFQYVNCWDMSGTSATKLSNRLYPGSFFPQELLFSTFASTVQGVLYYYIFHCICPNLTFFPCCVSCYLQCRSSIINPTNHQPHHSSITDHGGPPNSPTLTARTQPILCLNRRVAALSLPIILDRTSMARISKEWAVSGPKGLVHQQVMFCNQCIDALLMQTIKSSIETSVKHIIINK